MIIEKEAAQSWHDMQRAIDELNSNGNEIPVYRAALTLPLTQSGITAVVGAIAEFPSGFTLFLLNTGGAGEVFLICAIDGIWRVWTVTPSSGGMPLIDPAVANNLAIQAADGSLVDGGYAADVNATAGSVVRRDVEGRIVNQLENPAILNDGSVRIGSEYGAVVSLSHGGTINSKYLYAETAGNPVFELDTFGIYRFLGAGAVANRAAQRTELGLGTAALLTSTAVGEDLVTAVDVDGARETLDLPPQFNRPRYFDWQSGVWQSVDVVGSGTGTVALNVLHSLSSGATANSRIRRNIDSNILMLNRSGNGIAWNKRLDISLQIRRDDSNAEGVFRVIVGKLRSADFGTPAAGNYVGIKIENNTLTEGFVCKAGVLTSVVFGSPPNVNANRSIFISSLNGTVSWYFNNVVIGTTTAGPTAEDDGTLNLEMENGATAANYSMRLVGESWGY